MIDQALQQEIQTWATTAAAGAGVLTFLALIWYTIETQRLRRAAEKQNQIAGMPIVVLRLLSGERKLGEPLLLSFQSVRNVGNGPAFNINLSPIKKPPFEVTFSSIAILEPKENATLDFTIYQDAITSGMAKMTVWLESVIETGQLGSEMAVGISYADASGKRYRSNHVVRFDIASKAVTTEFKSHQELVE